jgi:CDP-diacylglycerol--glycerol-3-phosphate 3-phosphatidyltransferase
MFQAQDELSRHKVLNLPNVLTYLRIAAIPVILFLLAPPAPGSRMNAAFLLFVAASITDLLDGILARRNNQVTSIGKLLDPLADKLLTSAVLIMLTALGKVPGWLVFLIIGREMTITGLRSIAASQGLILKASPMGKRKMVSQTIALAALLIYFPHFQIALDRIGMFFLWASLILGYWSAGSYFLHFYQEATRQAQN